MSYTPGRFYGKRMRGKEVISKGKEGIVSGRTPYFGRKVMAEFLS